jgi:hypothetical protein
MVHDSQIVCNFAAKYLNTKHYEENLIRHDDHGIPILHGSGTEWTYQHKEVVHTEG